jgi:catechol 2,3-dioxygenase-like lactoylglutathione lyase family enzyme
MNMIRGVKFTSIPVTDQDRALAFYTEKLGFRLLTDQQYNDKQRWIELGISGTDTRVVLFRFDDGVQPGTKMNITFWADDVERTVRELESKGVKFVTKAQKADWGTAAIFKDLDGNTFVISSK